MEHCGRWESNESVMARRGDRLQKQVTASLCRFKFDRQTQSTHHTCCETLAAQGQILDRQKPKFLTLPVAG